MIRLSVLKTIGMKKIIFGILLSPLILASCKDSVNDDKANNDKTTYNGTSVVCDTAGIVSTTPVTVTPTPTYTGSYHKVKAKAKSYASSKATNKTTTKTETVKRELYDDEIVIREPMPVEVIHTGKVTIINTGVEANTSNRFTGQYSGYRQPVNTDDIDPKTGKKLRPAHTYGDTSGVSDGLNSVR
jgi:hypothetical protein